MRRDLMTDPASTLRLEAFLPYRLNVLGSVVSEGLARVYSSRFGLDIPGWRVIATLGQFGSANAKTIGQHSHMHKTKVSRAIAELEGRDLVKRNANSTDRRENDVSLTVEGEHIYKEIVPLAEAYQAKLLEALEFSDRKQLDQLLHALTLKAQELLIDGG